MHRIIKYQVIFRYGCLYIELINIFPKISGYIASKKFCVMKVYLFLFNGYVIQVYDIGERFSFCTL